MTVIKQLNKCSRLIKLCQILFKLKWSKLRVKTKVIMVDISKKLKSIASHLKTDF